MALQTVEFRSRILSREAAMNVCVPHGGGRYPVLYLYHGLGDTYAAFRMWTDIESLAERFDMIVVMPDAADSWFVNDTREGGLAWEDHLAGELVDFVDNSFSTVASREGRALAGFSMGGYGAMMYALKHPDRFCAVWSKDGSFMFGHRLRPDRPGRSAFMNAVAPPGGKYDLWVLGAAFAWARAQSAIRFEVGLGSHLLEHNRLFHDHLGNLGVVHEYREVEGGHEWNSVNRDLPAGLQFVYDKLREAG